MKIAFTSCCDPWNDPIQAAWPELVKQEPDFLVLLGDNMYMDYGFGNNPLGLSQPKYLDLQQFSDRMHSNYEKQWKVQNFHDSISRIPKIFAIWDDHDFAWNNSRGLGTGRSIKNVPTEYRVLSRALFEQFRDALASTPKQANYPKNLFPNGTPTIDHGSIAISTELADDVRLHLLDGRTFRPKPDTNASFLGETQRQNIENEFKKYPNSIHIIASGTTLEDWESYDDFIWLHSISKNVKVIVLSGDIHMPAIRDASPVFEFTASAMAQTDPISTKLFKRKSNVFGILNINKNDIAVDIFQFDVANNTLIEQKKAIIARENWQLNQTI